MGMVSMPHRGLTGRRLVGAGGLILLAATLALHHGPASPVLVAGYGTSPGAASFSISGTTKGLYPGVVVPLVLTVANPQSVPITVTAIATSVAGSTSCPAADVKVAGFTGQLHVAAKSTSKVMVQAFMTHAAPTGCQGAVLAFHYGGMATEG